MLYCDSADDTSNDIMNSTLHCFFIKVQYDTTARLNCNTQTVDLSYGTCKFMKAPSW